MIFLCKKQINVRHNDMYRPFHILFYGSAQPLSIYKYNKLNNEIN
jgi:hypothetical protein